MPLISRSELGQLLNLSVDLIPETNKNRSGRSISPKYITVHNTSNSSSGADASAHSRFVNNQGYYVLKSGKKNFVSWHYTVDDIQIIKHLPINERAIHAGAGNGVSIGIEICMHAENNKTQGDIRAQRLIAVLMHDLKISKDNIKPHQHWTGKACPTLLLSDFDNFVQGAETIRQSIIPATETNDGTLTTSEIDAALFEQAEAVVEANAPPEDNPEEEHSLVAVEVEAFVSTLEK